MVTFEGTTLIGKQHLDEGGHANWILQQTLAQTFHYECRQKLGFGLEALRSQQLFFVMRQVEARYYKELFEGDKIILQLKIEILGHTQLAYEFRINSNGELATEVRWLMPLISLDRSGGKARLIRLPEFIINAVGKPKPYLM